MDVLIVIYVYKNVQCNLVLNFILESENWKKKFRENVGICG